MICICTKAHYNTNKPDWNVGYVLVDNVNEVSKSLKCYLDRGWRIIKKDNRRRTWVKLIK